MRHAEKAGGIVLNTRGEVLVITNDIGRQTLPKGTPEKNEDLEDTARREIDEESGLTDIKIHRKIGILVRPGYSDNNKVTPPVIKHIHFYFCTTDQDELKPHAPDVISATWVNQDEIAQILSWPEEVKFFQEHRDTLKP